MSREAVNCEDLPKYTIVEEGFIMTTYGQVAEITGDSLETVCNMGEQERQDIISVSGLDKDVFPVNTGVENCNKRRRTIPRQSTGDTTKRVRRVGSKDKAGLNQEEIAQILDRSNSPNSSHVGSTPPVVTDSQSPIFRKTTNKPLARVSNYPRNIVTEDIDSVLGRISIDGEINANTIEQEDDVHEAKDDDISVEDDLELTYQEDLLRLQDIFITKTSICDPELTSSPELLYSPLSRLPTHLALLRARQLPVYRPCYVSHSRRKEDVEKFGSVMAGVRRKALSHCSSDCVPVWKPLSETKSGKNQIGKRTKERPIRECRRKNETVVETIDNDDDDFIAAGFNVKSQSEDIFDEMSKKKSSKQIGKKIHERPKREFRRKNVAALKTAAIIDLFAPSTSKNALAAGFYVKSQNEVFDEILDIKTFKQSVSTEKKYKFFPSKTATKIDINTTKLTKSGLESTSGSTNTSGLFGGEENVVSDEDVQFIAQKMVTRGSVSPHRRDESESRNVKVKEEQVPLRRCPLCNEIFNDVIKLETHASNCEGDW